MGDATFNANGMLLGPNVVKIIPNKQCFYPRGEQETGNKRENAYKYLIWPVMPMHKIFQEGRI